MKSNDGTCKTVEIEQHPAAEISASLKGFTDAPQEFRKHVMTGFWHVLRYSNLSSSVGRAR